MGSERDTDRDLYFTTETADQCFLDEFVTGLGAVVQGEISTAAEMYNDIGALWYSMEKMLAGLKGADAHGRGVVAGRGCPLRGGAHTGAALGN